MTSLPTDIVLQLPQQFGTTTTKPAPPQTVYRQCIIDFMIELKNLRYVEKYIRLTLIVCLLIVVTLCYKISEF